MTRMAMTIGVATVLLSAVGGPDEGGRFDPYAGPRPVLVWIRTDPWAMVLGSDTPTLSLYEDGAVTCVVRASDKSATHLQRRLAPKDLDETLRTIRALGPFSSLKHQYDLAPGVTDLPTTRFYLDLGAGPPIVTEVYGLGVVRPGEDRLPASLSALQKYLATTPCEGTPWVPQYVEVMLWPYEYAPEESIHWPSDWPGLDSPRAVRRGDLYSIYLPGTSLDRLQDFLQTRRQKGAVAVGGKKWAASYRYVFPSEPVWAEAFSKARSN